MLMSVMFFVVVGILERIGVTAVYVERSITNIRNKSGR